MSAANDRYKARLNHAYWYGLAAATIVHFLLLQYGPAFALERYDRPEAPPIRLQPPRPYLPPPPQPIARPAFPVASADVSVEATFAPVTFDEYVPPPPPPPAASSGSAEVRATFERFVPTMTAPRVLNAAEVERRLQQHYPPLLRDAGIEGVVGVQLWLDERGRVVDAQVVQTSGYPAMDAAALHLTDVMRLTPALNRGRPVRVTVVLPVQFQVR